MIYPGKGLQKYMFKVICLSIFIFIKVYVYAQPANDNCSQASLVCSNEILRGTTEGATTDDYLSDCIFTNPAVWYTFTTNGDRIGNVIVSVFRDSLCNNPAFTGDGLQGVILQSTNPSDDPCINNSLFLVASDCEEDDDTLRISTTAPTLPNTKYWVQIGGRINDQGFPTQCKFSISISGAPVEIYAGNDGKIFKGASDTIRKAAGPDPGTFFWDPATSLSDENTLSPIADPDETTTYTLTGDIGGCKNLTDQVTITVRDKGVTPENLIVPTSVELGTWNIGDIENFPKAAIEVFNRWGQRVFVSIGYENSNGWNGTYNGNDLPEGTYYYVIQLNRPDLNVENVQTGFVAIVR